MNSVVFTIAKDELRYWHRSKLAISVIVLMVLFTIASVIVTGISSSNAVHERTHLQEKAEHAFLDQPDRHPHRMVHYGHYVFRNPPPLSAIDPGVDPYTGTSIFLEGHRQNSAMFSAQRQSGGLTRFSSLTPSFVVQVLMPLLLILVGYSVVSRERESGTVAFVVAQGVSPGRFLVGKFVALLSAGVLVMLPLKVAGVFAIAKGESIGTTLGFLSAYGLYILVWSLLVLAVSTLSKKNSTSFVLLVSIWIVLCLLVPRIAASSASSMVASPSKLESDFEVKQELRKLGDGHNAADPAFVKLKANLLARYNVDSLEELPVNFRGIVAQTSEAQLTQILNQFAEKRLREEREQAQIVRNFGWLSPALALRTVSMMLAGTNLETHHRFLRQAEQLRYDFVQGLNKVHTETLSYQADMARNIDQAHSDKARVDASNWQILDSFAFEPDAPPVRLANSLSAFFQLSLWLIVLFVLARAARRKLL